jgi:hypothetical protein
VFEQSGLEHDRQKHDLGETREWNPELLQGVAEALTWRGPLSRQARRHP